MKMLINSLKNEERIETLHKRTLEKKLDDLKEYEGMILIPSIRPSGRVYYYTFDPKTGKRKYLGGEECEAVQCIKAMHHMKLSVKLMERNSSLLIPVIEGYADTDPDAVEALLPKVYQNSRFELAGPADPRAAEWKKAKEQFKANYLRKYPDKHPETLTYERRNGDKMRSKSEGSIADILDLNELTFVYELPHRCNGYWLLSDFTVLSPLDYFSEIIIEHAGRMDLESYRNKYIFSLEQYMKEGYRPNINLFFTFDNLDKTFSEIPVQNILDNWLCKSA